jgi:hypothetical protein
MNQAADRMHPSNRIIGPTEQFPESITLHEEAKIVSIPLLNPNDAGDDRQIFVYLNWLVDGHERSLATWLRRLHFLEEGDAIVDRLFGISALEREFRRENIRKSLSLPQILGFVHFDDQVGKYLSVIHLNSCLLFPFT